MFVFRPMILFGVTLVTGNKKVSIFVGFFRYLPVLEKGHGVGYIPESHSFHPFTRKIWINGFVAIELKKTPKEGMSNIFIYSIR